MELISSTNFDFYMQLIANTVYSFGCVVFACLAFYRYISVCDKFFAADLLLLPNPALVTARRFKASKFFLGVLTWSILYFFVAMLNVLGLVQPPYSLQGFALNIFSFVFLIFNLALSLSLIMAIASWNPILVRLVAFLLIFGNLLSGVLTLFVFYFWQDSQENFQRLIYIKFWPVRYTFLALTPSLIFFAGVFLYTLPLITQKNIKKNIQNHIR